jgi:hypothetical protein
MRHLVLVLCLLFCAGAAFAQNTTVSGTITDAGSQVWNNGTYNFAFQPAANNPSAQYYFNGAPFSRSTNFGGSLNSSGAFSVGIPPNTSITPSGSTWAVQVCSAATSPCYTVSLTITGATQNISASVIPPAIAINLAVSPGSFTTAYSDSEITSALVGSSYYNLTLQNQRYCQAVTGQACTTWASGGGGGGGAPGGSLNSVQYNAGSSTFGGVLGTVSGQPLTAVNASPPAFLSPKLLTRTVSATTDAPLCDSATTIQDRTNIVKYTSTTGLTITVPDAANSGCGNGFALVLDVVGGASNATVNRQTASTFTILNTGATNQTTFTLQAGGQARLESPDGTNWDVFLSGSGSGSATVTGTNCEPAYLSTTANLLETLGVYFYANCFAGATPDVQVNACLTAAQAVNGTCDTSALNGTQIFAAQVTVGCAGSTPCPVQLIFPVKASWQFSMTDGTSCGIKQYAYTDVEGFNPGGTIVNFTIKSAVGANLAYVYCTDSSAESGGGGRYYHAAGFGIGTGAAQAGGAAMYVSTTDDNSKWERISVFDTAGDACAAKADSVTSNTVFENDAFNSNYTAGSAPFCLTETNSTNAKAEGVIFLNDNFTHPGAGLNAFYAQDTSTQHALEVMLDNVYIETSNTDTTTPLIYADGLRAITVKHPIYHTEVASDVAPGVYITNSYNTKVSVTDTTFDVGSNQWTYPAITVSQNNTSYCSSTPCLIYTDGVGNDPGYHSGYATFDNARILNYVQLFPGTSTNNTIKTNLQTLGNTSNLTEFDAFTGSTQNTQFEFNRNVTTSGQVIYQFYKGDGTNVPNATIVGQVAATTFFAAVNGNVALGSNSCANAFTILCVGSAQQFLVSTTGTLTSNNNANAGNVFHLSSGLSATQLAQVDFQDQATDKWLIGKNTTNQFTVYDSGANINRILMSGGGDTVEEAGCATCIFHFQTSGAVDFLTFNTSTQSASLASPWTLGVAGSFSLGGSTAQTGITGTDTKLATAGTTVASSNVTCTDANSGYASGTATCGTPALFMKFVYMAAVAGTGTVDTFPAINRAINVDSMSLYVITPPAGCSTYPVEELLDTTASQVIGNVTLAAATNQYTVTVSHAGVPLGDQLALRTNTAPVGCSTNAGFVSLNVQYH